MLGPLLMVLLSLGVPTVLAAARARALTGRGARRSGTVGAAGGGGRRGCRDVSRRSLGGAVEVGGRLDAGLPGTDLLDADLLDAAVLCELVAAAVEAGLSIPRAVEVVAEALGGTSRQGVELAAVAGALRWGASWPVAWAATGGVVAQLGAVLEPAWEHGSAPGQALRAAAAAAHRRQRAAARTAAGRLGVLVVLPLGLCLLPAFMLLGLVPVVLSLARGVL